MTQPFDSKRRDLAVLWTKAQPNVSAFVSSLVGDFHDAEDIIQQVAAAAAERFDDYDPERPFVAWAIGIARHKVYNHLRSSGRDKHVFDSEALGDIAEAYQRIEPELTEARAALDDCMKKVQGKTRQVLELRYVRDLKPSAIGDKMGMKANAVYVMLHRLRAALTTCVKSKLGRSWGQP